VAPAPVPVKKSVSPTKAFKQSKTVVKPVAAPKIKKVE